MCTCTQTYDIFFKDLSTGQMLADVIKETSGSFVWGADASTVFYEKMDAAHRPYQLWVHVMGTPQEEDVMLFEEKVDLLGAAIGGCVWSGPVAVKFVGMIDGWIDGSHHQHDATRSPSQTGRAAVDGHPQDGQRPLPRHEPGGEAAERELGPRSSRCVYAHHGGRRSSFLVYGSSLIDGMIG